MPAFDELTGNQKRAQHGLRDGLMLRRGLGDGLFRS